MVDPYLCEAYSTTFLDILIRDNAGRDPGWSVMEHDLEEVVASSSTSNAPHIIVTHSFQFMINNGGYFMKPCL